MAPDTEYTHEMELLESSIIKPQPLRIIKRSQTIARCTSPREILGLGRRAVSQVSMSSSRGSPPQGADHPLTVRKIRKTRRSIFDSMDTETGIEDLELTPKLRKAKPVQRTVSAGQYIRKELQRRTSEMSLSKPNILDRKPSKSKAFFLKSIGIRNPQPIRLIQEPVESNVSEKTIHSKPPETGPDILCARISVTPEVETISCATCSVWVAVEILGHVADPEATVSGYGHLHNMQVELLAGRDCVVSEIVGNLYELKSVGPHETHLILVKMKLPASNQCIKKAETSDDLFADLEQHLSGNLISYLTIRLTYEHSGFSRQSAYQMDPQCAISFHTTTLRTQAAAYIRRTVESGIWAPRPAEGRNPVVQLIERHYGGDEAKDAIRRLAAERIHIPRALPALQCTTQADTLKSLPLQHPGPEPKKTTHVDENKNDPARKIWTEMRRTSRGRPCRSSISQGTYSSPLVPEIDEERSRIKQVALRNKRSVGADTLRSIAPSINDAGIAKGSIAAGLGLSRSWGWGGSWW